MYNLLNDVCSQMFVMVHYAVVTSNRRMASLVIKKKKDKKRHSKMRASKRKTHFPFLETSLYHTRALLARAREQGSLGGSVS